MAPTEYGDYRGRDFRLKYAERDVRDLSIEMLRECLSLLLNCDLSIKLSGGEIWTESHSKNFSPSFCTSRTAAAWPKGALMIHMNEALIVEGRYDKSKLSALTDAIIVTTNGFGIYKDAEKRDFIRKLAKERGIVILTDSDNAGRQIRAYITSFVPSNQIRHAYIPDIYGKEKRKAAPSKEGKLGVEGISSEILLEILKEAGASVEGSTTDFNP
mgnify:CR=1 FL=1